MTDYFKLAIRTLVLGSCLLVLAGLETSTALAARPISVSRYHTPYSSSVYRYSPRYSRYRYTSNYPRNYSYYRSTYYGYGARRYNYRYRPYAAVAGYRYYRPAYYGINHYPAGIGYTWAGSSFYPRPFCNAWNTYSSCYCSPYSGNVISNYVPYYGNYTPYMGSYTPLWGSYLPYGGSYFAAPGSYFGYANSGFYGYYCGVWPYRPTLYGSIVFQSGWNTGYGRGSYYQFW